MVSRLTGWVALLAVVAGVSPAVWGQVAAKGDGGVKPIDRAMVLTLGAIEPPAVAVVRQAINEARERQLNRALLVLDSPGGYVNETEQVVRLMKDSGLEWSAYIRRAAGAAIMPALQCPDIYVENSGIFGGAQPSAYDDPAGNILVDEKPGTLNPAVVRALAEAAGHPVDAVLPMVTPTSSRQSVTETVRVWSGRYEYEMRAVRRRLNETRAYTAAEAVEAKLARAGLSDAADLLTSNQYRVNTELAQAVFGAQWLAEVLRDRVFNAVYTPEVLSRRLRRGTTSAVAEVPMIGGRYGTKVVEAGQRVKTPAEHQRDRERFEAKVKVLRTRLDTMHRNITLAVGGGGGASQLTTLDDAGELAANRSRALVLRIRNELNPISTQLDEMLPYMVDYHAELISEATAKISRQLDAVLR